jgi:hypothetical protein
MGEVLLVVTKWVLAKEIGNITTAEEKAALVWILGNVKDVVDNLESKVSGDVKPIADELLVGFDGAVEACVTALQA